MNNISLNRFIIKTAAKTEPFIYSLWGASILVALGAAGIKNSIEISYQFQNAILTPAGYILLIVSAVLAILRLNYRDLLFISLAFPALLGALLIIL